MTRSAHHFFSVQLSPEPCITLFILPSLSGYVVRYYLSFHICNMLGLTVILWWQYNILLVQAFVLLWHFQLPSHHSVVVIDADIFLHIKANALAKPVSDFHSSNLMLSFSVQPTSVSASASFYLPSNFFITSILAINFAYHPCQIPYCSLGQTRSLSFSLSKIVALSEKDIKLFWHALPSTN